MYFLQITMFWDLEKRYKTPENVPKLGQMVRVKIGDPVPEKGVMMSEYEVINRQFKIVNGWKPPVQV